MYIRNRDEALDALSAVLALPERREQIIQITVKVALCLDADARRFLADAQAGLIEGGLEHMRKKRREMIEQQAAQSAEPIILIDSSQDQLLEAAGSAMDALRLADIIVQVFPDLQKAERWLVARAVLGEEQSIQEAVIAAVRERNSGDGTVAAQMEKHVREKIDAMRPAWYDSAGALRKAVEDTVRQLGPDVDVDLLHNVTAIDEDSARLVLELLGSSPPEAYAYIGEIRSRIQQLLSLEEANS